MSELDQVLARLQAHPGVGHVLLLGRDGLLIRRLGEAELAEPEVLAAMVPDLAAACTALGRASGRGDFLTAVVEFSGGVAVVVALPDDLLLALVLQPGVGFAQLLREVRAERDQLVALL